jgi:hypothetical protein
MKGNLIFAGIILAFLFSLVVMSSRPFLPDAMKQPAPTATQPAKP